MSDTRQDQRKNMNNAPRLDDEARVKVLSPTMLVMKRFMRNRLAIIGLSILVVMFLFSFIGGFLTPYGQTQVFRKYDSIPKDYASVIVNTELRYTQPEDSTFGPSAKAALLSAMNSKKTTFTVGGHSYWWEETGERYLRVFQNETLGTALGVGGNYTYSPEAGKTFTPEIITAFEEAMARQEMTFSQGEDVFQVEKKGKMLTVSRTSLSAIASPRIYNAYESANTAFVNSFAFRYACEEAVLLAEDSFTVDGTVYTVAADEDNVVVYRGAEEGEEPFAIISDLIVNASATDVFISVPFINAVLTALQDNAPDFVFPDLDGEEIHYRFATIGGTKYIRRDMVTQLIDMYAPPTLSHLLGTDANGMDSLTRLMYGGRVSLLVGFVVVLIELLIGIVIGGVAGYFGKWVDTLLMRFIDLFNCIPSWPVMIIVGAVMQMLDINPTARIFVLMLVLGLLGWTGIARVVRGQILTLREQDFMVAAEATGIRISRRIFKHLVPNVIPLLIVQATLSLGSVIITEATLSFLGLGLKYPMASWGTIISAASDVYVMTNYWFIWVPAGMLILLTVLGFNFVGDGLRDAFDPKMKR